MKNKTKKSILVVKCDTVEEFEAARDKFHLMGCRWDDGTGRPGHIMTNVWECKTNFDRGMRYLIQHGNVIKMGSTNNFKNDKFEVVTSKQFTS